jgi:PTS system cellobiose-specific IIA component
MASEELEQQIFEIISSVGQAKSLFIEAIHEAKKGQFEVARNKMKEGSESFVKGHRVHADILQKSMDVSSGSSDISLILIHAEDQIMAADSFKILAGEFIDLYETISKK